MVTKRSHRVEVDPNQIGDQIGPFLNALVIPRPIAWVSTRSRAGVDNVAPHSYFTIAPNQPPIVQFVSMGDKDSLRNVRETGEFVVNITTSDLADAINVTATDYPPAMSEFDAAGLAREASLRVQPPRVAASPVAIECIAAGEHRFPHSTVVFGEVVHIAINPAVMRDDRVVAELLDPLARLGRSDWMRFGEPFEPRRIPYRSPENG